MIHNSYKRFFRTLANDNRLRIVQFLQKNGPKTVSEIVAGTGLEQTLISHHLKRLYDCHFIDVAQQGKTRVYRLNADTIGPLLVLMNKHVNTYCVNCEVVSHE